MKRTFLYISLLFINYLLGQEQDINKIELNKHDLSWINPNSINQDSLSMSEIENEIKLLVEKQANSEVFVADMIVPFNEKKLKYIGFIHPNEIGMFDNYRITSKSACEMNQKNHIYKYDDFYISTEEDDRISQENIYYSLRAYLILKYRYKKAYINLFEKTRTILKPNPSQGFDLLNTNKAFWIAFNYNPVDIAANRAYYILDGYVDDDKKISLYRNVAFVNIHSNNILGKSKFGSKPIYNEENSSLNRYSYLKEGLIETIVHEMLHNYISYAYTASREYNAINNMRNKHQGSFMPFEENIVVNTSLSYFYKQGGLKNQIKDFYYTKTFDKNIESLKTKRLFQSYYKSVFNIEPGNIKEEMKMSVLN
ncbi:hypothetical protein D1816_12425 [Aquimarina sp. AD10]|uniref:hypothetical protein n=1 Tax=Aquimarina sp. AD10 TaxID=1714849 RepID=UPI000E51FC56|nr:hypothetical protein [Aquimarina sp. AD10]AXT61120.1 hypothetical protein D1816_12425 [Aquimarina sp. AD10]RKN02264.1 hypothetical protein D7033_02185 [Aquimarina sp. AD10]